MAESEAEAQLGQVQLLHADQYTESAAFHFKIKAAYQRKLACCEERHIYASSKVLEAATLDAKANQSRMHLLGSENSELRLQMLRWRKKTAVLRLKLSSSEESVRQLQSNGQAMQNTLMELLDSNERLQTSNTELQQQLQQLQDQQQHTTHTRQEADALHNQLHDDLRRERDSLTQQLAGCQLSLGSTARRAEELQAQVDRVEAEAEQSARLVSTLKDQLIEARSSLLSAQHAAMAAETAKRLSEERVLISEQALSEWKRVEEERKRLMHDREQQLKDLSQEHAKLSSDRASLKEDQLQAQIRLLQAQLDSDIGARQHADLALRQQLGAAKVKLDAETRRARMLEEQLSAKQATIASLEECLKGRTMDTPSGMIERANAAVDRILTELVPVSEGDEEEQEEVQAPAPRAPRVGTQPMPVAQAAPAPAPAQVKEPKKKTARSKPRAGVAAEAEPASQPTRQRVGSRHTAAAVASAAEECVAAKRTKRRPVVEDDASDADSSRDDDGAGGDASDGESPQAAKPGRGATKGRKVQPGKVIQQQQRGRAKGGKQGQVPPQSETEEEEEEEQRPKEHPIAAGKPAQVTGRLPAAQRPAQRQQERPASPSDAGPAVDQEDHTVQPQLVLEPREQVQAVQAAAVQPDGSAMPTASQLTNTMSQGGSRFLGQGMLTLFRSRVADQPLATLNPHVLQAAAARRGRVPATAKQALKRLSIGGSAGGAGASLILSGIKRKPHQALRTLQPDSEREAGDVLPMDMMLDSLKVPKLRHTQG